eukprot:scaffold150140_cov18-Prasinocladus_malaysianus.AAC.1
MAVFVIKMFLQAVIATLLTYVFGSAGNVEATKALLDVGADPGLQDSRGRSAMSIARQQQQQA